MNKLIITADLGHVKIYRVTQDDLDTENTKPAIELEVDLDLPDNHSRFENRDTDKAGRFSRGATSGTPSGMSYGERHGEETEAARCQLQRVAQCIAEEAGKDTNEGMYLAAPKPIHKRLLEALPPEVRSRLIEHLAVDLVKAEKRELLQRFKLIQK